MKQEGNKKEHWCSEAERGGGVGGLREPTYKEGSSQLSFYLSPTPINSMGRILQIARTPQ